MGIRINSNIFSLLINRNMLTTSAKLEKAMGRLSTGERINRSGDDAAGLASSHMLRTKITGLQRNLRNCDEGINLLSVAESSLGNVSETLQRLRELAVQASNDTITDEQRALAQKEVDQLLDEIQRLATTTNYNERNLLDGSFSNLVLQVGTRQGETMPISIEDMRTSVLGSMASVTGDLQVGSGAIAGGGDLAINGVAIPASRDDELSTIASNTSALAKAKAINSVSNQTGVTAQAEATVHSVPTATISAGSLDGVAASLIINGVNIGAANFQDGDTDGVLCDAINRYSTKTGVTASLGSNGQLVLTAEDFRNIEITTTGNSAATLGLASAGAADLNGEIVRGHISLHSSNTIQVTGALDLIGFATGLGTQATTYVDPASAIGNLKITSYKDAQSALTTIDAAARQILERRAALGALESRVNKTVDDLMLTIENLMASDSRIRDADFAVETSNMTQAQIVQEAGIAILAQANVIPQMALELLKR